MNNLTALNILEAQGVDIRSPMSAVRSIRRDDLNEERPELSAKESCIRIGQLLDKEIKIEDQKEAFYGYMYLAQELVKTKDQELEVGVVYQKATEQTTNFIKEHKRFWEAAEAKEPSLDADGNPKARKGDKKQLAQAIFDEHYGTKSRAEIIALLVEEAGLTEKGAPTYFYNMKKKFKEL